VTTRAGLWIDHRKAVVVTVSDEGEETKTIESNVEKHVRYSGGAHREPEDTRERRFEGELDKYYDEVIASIRDVEAILIIGPGEAKGELKARLERSDRGDRVIAIETVDKMTDRQIAARVRQHFSGGTS
jgi:stalled ribosome rescue protein Dom34